jgi:hypothetical protein
MTVSAFQGPPSLPAFGLLHNNRPQRSRTPVDMTIVTPPPQVLNAARAGASQFSRKSALTRPTRHSIRRRPRVRSADESMQIAAMPTSVAPARHRYRDVAAAPTHELLARWRHQAVNALCYARIAVVTGVVSLVHAVAAPLHKQLGCQHFATASLDHCIQLQRLFLGLARHQKAARTCLARAAQVAPHGRCYADGGECFLY